MRHARHLRKFVIAVAAAATPAVAGAQAATPPPIVMVEPANDMIAAAIQLQNRLATASANSAPLLTNAGAAMVRNAFDREALRAMPLDLRMISGTCGAIGKTLVAYMEFANRITNKDREAANRVALKMQAEISLGLAAGNVCVQRSFRAAEALMHSMPPPNRPEQAREGLKQMRHGAAQAIQGSLDAVLSSGNSPKNRDMVISAVLEDAPALAASFPQAERDALRAMVLNRVDRATGTDRTKLQAIAQAYGASACNVVCRFAGAN